MTDEVQIPNSMGHQLIVCRVVFERSPPLAEVSVEYQPIIAFERASNGAFEPLLLTGKIVGWNQIRASVIGANIYGICGAVPRGVTTPSNSYSSVEDFSEHSKVLVALAVEKVRLEKGWSTDSLPMRLIRREVEFTENILDESYD